MTFVGGLSWDEVGRRIEAGAVAVLPVGAGAKEHGLHLPMRTDEIQAEHLAARLARRFDALVWPTVAYGFYPAFAAYPGSVSLSEATFEATVREIAGGLLGFGARGVAVLDTGISTIPVVARALAALAEPNLALHLKMHDGPRYAEAAARLATQSHGGHADELETARMLAIAPDLVRMARATVGTTVPPGPGPLQRSAPDAPNHSPSGAIGDPRGATAGMGETLLAAMADDMAETVAAWRARLP